MFVYVGCYTEPGYDGRGDGIGVFRFDAEAGLLTAVETVTGIANPSFLALDGEERFLFAVNEVADGAVSAFRRDPQSGRLTLLNREASHGADPCHVSLAAGDRSALIANYTGGTVAVLPVAGDGRLGAATSVVRHQGSSVRPEQEGPHPHMMATAPDGRVIVTDLGADRVFVYRLDAETRQLEPHDEGGGIVADPGAGPRHFAFAPNGRTLYVINELASTLSVFGYDGERGALQPMQTVSTLPDGYAGENSCAHVAVSPDGRFVYGSNRGHDSIAIWAVGEDGGVTFVGHESTRGRTPRNFALDPTGDWLLAANQDSDTIVIFRRDRETGTLRATGEVTETLSPVAVVFSGES